MGKRQASTGRSFDVMYRVMMAVAMVMAPATHTMAGVTHETRVLSGDAAPDGNGSFSSFDFPVLNDAGQVAFTASLVGTNGGSLDNVGVFRGDGAGGLVQIAREGQAAPDGNGILSNFNLSRLVLNDAGQVGFKGQLALTSGLTADDDGNFRGDGATGLVQVARENQFVPGSGTFSNLNSGANLNNAGQTAFTATLVSLSNGAVVSHAAVFRGDGAAAPVEIARQGDAAPGTPAGIEFSRFKDPVINNAGQTAFAGYLTGRDVDYIDKGIWSEAVGSSGNPGLVARTGDAAPGTPSGVNFIGLSGPVFNDAGQTAFTGYLTGTGVDFSNIEGLWSEAAGSIGNPGLVARTGAAAPGTPAGVKYSTFGNYRYPVLNDMGETAFTAYLTGTSVDFSNDQGIWSEAAGSIGNPGLVVRKGDAAPGTAPGVHFGELSEPLLNNSGQIAFSSYLTGTGLDYTNDEGLWATDANGQLNLIVREGDLFDVDDDPLNEELRTVALIGTYAGFSNQNSPFNDAGQFVFSATFTDGSSGIFVANTLATLLGDYSGNGIVDAADYTVWADSFGSTSDLAADGNGDGVVDAADYTIWADNFGSSNISSNSQSTIPEPETGLVLLGMGLAAGCRRAG